MASAFYNSGKTKLWNGGIDPDTDTIKASFLLATYTPDVDAHDAFDDISAHEVPATGGYSAGGVALASKTVTQDNTNNRAVFDAVDILIASSTISSVRYVALYKDTGTPATSYLICYIDLLVAKSTAGDDFEIEWNASGIFYY